MLVYALDIGEQFLVNCELANVWRYDHCYVHFGLLP